MRTMTEEEKRYYVNQTDTVPNKGLVTSMLMALFVILICWGLTEAGTFRVGLDQMRFCAAVSGFFIIIPQFFRFGNILSKPVTKYILLFSFSSVIFAVTTALMFHSTIGLILPMVAATFYKTKKMGHFSFILSVIITIFSPVVSFIYGMWDSLFLQVLLQFCGYESSPASVQIFSKSESVLQILLYIVLPRLMIVCVVGIVTMGIVNRNARALEDRMAIMHSNEQITSIQEDTLECLATIIESRDGNTGAHVKNTKECMRIFVNYMIEHKLYTSIINEESAYRIVNASVLHDIGKIAIPDSILTKPGRLTEEEYEIMKTHCLEGDKFINKAFQDNPDREFISTAHEIVAFHHEKVNGSGYPYGLVGYGIPLPARMMAIVDAFDAIISARVYKPAKTLEEAFEVLRRDSGTHFDGDLVEIFIAAYSEEKLAKNK